MSEKFTIEKVGSNKYALKGGRDQKYCADEGEHGVKCNRNAAPKGGWEQFEVEVVDADKNVVAFKGGKDGKFCADEGNMIKCNRGSVGGWEKFTVIAAAPPPPPPPQERRQERRQERQENRQDRRQGRRGRGL